MSGFYGTYYTSLPQVETVCPVLRALTWLMSLFHEQLPANRLRKVRGRVMRQGECQLPQFRGPRYRLTCIRRCIIMVYTSEVLMVRTQIYLTEQDREGLATLSKATGMKLSELIREAVNGLLAQSSRHRRDAVLDAAAGLWKNRDDLPDFASTRAAWDRSKA